MIGTSTILQSTIKFISNSSVDVAIYPSAVMIPNIGDNVRVTKNLKLSQKKYLTQNDSKNNIYSFLYNKNYKKLYFCDSQGYLIIGKKSHLNKGMFSIVSPYYEGGYNKEFDRIDIYIGKDKNLCIKLNKIEYRGYVITRMYYNDINITRHIYKFSWIFNSSFSSNIIFGEEFSKGKVIEFKFSEFVNKNYHNIPSSKHYLSVYRILSDEDSILMYTMEYDEDTDMYMSSITILLYKNRYMVICGYTGAVVIDFESDKAIAIPSDVTPYVYRYDGRIYVGKYIIYFDENANMEYKENKEGFYINEYVFLNGCEVSFISKNFILIEYLFEIPTYVQYNYKDNKLSQIFSMTFAYYSGLNIYTEKIIIRKEYKGKTSEGDAMLYVPILLTQLFQV